MRINKSCQARLMTGIAFWLVFPHLAMAQIEPIVTGKPCLRVVVEKLRSSEVIARPPNETDYAKRILNGDSYEILRDMPPISQEQILRILSRVQGNKHRAM